MSKSSIIGQLRVILGLDTAAFEKGLDDSQRQLIRAAKSYEQIGRRIEGIGRSLSIGLTLPLVAVGGAALKMAANFETAMNKVEGATGAGGAQLKSLRDAALAFGRDKTVTATATEAATAMENLAKNGISVTDMLGGATAATLRLASATGGDYGQAADLTTALMNQFGISAGKLPKVVDQVSGALVESKLDFDNYAQAVGQAGGVAGNVMPFEEFNAAIAATATSFSSGSDAGTSFKTFLQRLVPQSKEAAGMMKKLGIDFFDAGGKMKPLAAIAQILQDKLGGLSDKARTNALQTLFGADSSRTAVALMTQGAAGIERFTAAIDKASAQTQIDARLKGWAYSINLVQKAFENAAIRLGDSGFLGALTEVAVGVANLIGAFSDLPTPVLHVIGLFAGVAAAVGPVVFVTGKLLGVWGAMLQLGPRLAIMFAATAASETAVAGAGLTAAGAMTALRGAMTFLTGPWGLLIGGIAAALTLWAFSAEKADQATQDAEAGLRKLAAAHGGAKTATEALDKATGAAAGTMKSAAAQAQELATKLYGVEAGAKAAMLALARQRLTEAKAQQARVQGEDTRTPFARMMGVQKGASRVDKADQAAAQRKVEGTAKMVELAQLEYDSARIDAVAGDINRRFGSGRPTPVAPAGTSNPDLSNGSGGNARAKHGPSPEELARRREELRLEVEIQAAEDRGDTMQAQGLRDQLDLQRRIKDYESAGLKTDAARVAAAADLKTLAASRAEAMRREVEIDQRAMELENASIAGNGVLRDSLERQAYLAERVAFWRSKLPTLEQATAAAMADQAKHEAAIATARASQAASAEAQRQISLAQARGDTEEHIRLLQQTEDIRRRSEDLQRGADGQAPLDKAKADAQATTEALQSEQARQTGIFRDTIKGGLRAALDGNFGSWFSSWWKDRVAKGMEDALNSLADLIESLFSKAGQGGSGGGDGIGGLLSTIGTAFGSIFGGGGGGGGAFAQSAGMSEGLGGGFEGFKGGGSFKVGGRSGIDANLVSFRATAGELVNVTKGGDRGASGASPTLVFQNDFRGADADAVTGIKSRLDRMERELPGKIIGTVSDAKTRGVLR